MCGRKHQITIFWISMRLILSAIGILGSPILQLYVEPLCQVKKPGYSELFAMMDF